MKLTTIILFATTMLVSASLYSQTTRLTLNFSNITYGELFLKIEEQSEYSFAFTGSNFDPNQRIRIDVTKGTLAEILKEVLPGDVTYEIIDRYVVIRNADEKDAPVTQQQKSVSGKLTDSEGQPIPGVSVIIKGTTNGTVTNVDGKYSLASIPANAILQFSFVGMKTQEKAVGGQTRIDVVMELDVIGLDEIIAVGYGVMKKSDITGSVQRVDAAQFAAQQSTNMLDMLSGTVAGFNSTQGTSAAGGGTMEIRGPTSLAANTNPLIVLDGVIYNGNIGDINPNDIESIDILKDASSSAIFGARSASGVLIVTTKRGRTSKPTIHVSSKVGLGDVTNQLYPLTPEQYLESRGDFYAGVFPEKPDYYYSNPYELPDGISIEEWKSWDVTSNDDIIQMWFDRMGMKQVEVDNYKAGKTVNWLDLILRNGLRQDYDISLSGGTESLRYYWNLGYTDNKGVLLGDDYNNVRSRINIDADVTDFFSVGVNVQFSDRNQSSESISLDDAIRASPYGNIYEEDGKTLTFYPHDIQIVKNPLLYHNLLDKLSLTQQLFANLFGELKLPYGISYKVSFVNRYAWGKYYNFYPVTTPIGFSNNGVGTRIDFSSYEWQIDNIFTWNKTIADIHNFNTTFLVNAEKYQEWKSKQENSQFSPSGALSFHALQAGISPKLTDNDEYETGNALMARFNYTLMDKYIITATWRRDGYSAFGQKHPYAEFPSAALAWRISEEDFFKIGWIDQLKLRASWGANGNRAVGRYDALSRLATTKYIYGTTLATGVYTSTMANSDLRWERTQALNFGVDFGLFGNVLYGSVDYYDMTTRDLLLNRSLPRIIGYSSVVANLGELGNKGFELTLNSLNLNKRNIKWNSNLVFSLNRNKIKHLYGEMINVVDDNGNVIGQKEADDIANRWFIGQALDRIWDYKILGVWQLDEAEQAEIYGKRPGDMKLRDVNEDDVLNPSGDKVFQGYKNPRFRLGLRNDLIVFKNIEISAFLRADLDFYGANNMHLNSEAYVYYETANRLHTKYWTKDNPINDYARLNSEASSPAFNYWENRSFVRLQDLSVSYNVPATRLKKIQNLKIYLSFRNLLTFTGWKHYDPESQTSMMPKVSTIGIDITL